MLLLASAYGTKHLIILACSILLIAALLYFLKNKKEESWYRVLLLTGIVSESLKVFTYIALNEDKWGGYLPKADLPFQLCSIQLIFIALLNFSKNDNIKRLVKGFMMPTCLIGGLAALAIPTYSSLNHTVITIQYNLYHSVIIAYAIHLTFSNSIKWEFNDYVRTLVMFILIAFAAIYINSICVDVYKDAYGVLQIAESVNFLYVVDPPASGLPLLNKDHGQLVYMAHLGSIAFIAISAFYIKPIIEKIKSLFNKKAE